MNILSPNLSQARTASEAGSLHGGKVPKVPPVRCVPTDGEDPDRMVYGRPLDDGAIFNPTNTPAGRYSCSYRHDDCFGLQMIISAIRLVEAELAAGRHAKTLKRCLQAYGPYCILRMESGAALLLNRSYKPCGLQDRSTYIDYETYGFMALPADRIDARWAARLYPDRFQLRAFFYGQDSVPWLDRASCL
jgi:hypothetical protein